MSAELHARILPFLLGEFAKRDNHVCVSLELMFVPGGGNRDDLIRDWIRADDPERFEPAKAPDFVSEIIEIAEGDADAKPPGRYTYYLRTKHYMGARQKISFPLQPNYSGQAEDSTAIALAAGGSRDGAQALQTMTGFAQTAMRTNTQMFDQALRSQSAANERLSKQNAELHAENILLRREVDEARSTKMERQWTITREIQKDERAAAGWKQAMNIASIVAAKVAGGAGAANGAATSLTGQSSAMQALQALLGNFRDSISPEQFQTMLTVFSQVQLMMLNEIMAFAPAPEQPPQQEAAPQNGAPPQ